MHSNILGLPVEFTGQYSSTVGNIVQVNSVIAQPGNPSPNNYITKAAPKMIDLLQNPFRDSPDSNSTTNQCHSSQSLFTNSLHPLSSTESSFAGSLRSMSTSGLAGIDSGRRGDAAVVISSNLDDYGAINNSLPSALLSQPSNLSRQSMLVAPTKLPTADLSNYHSDSSNYHTANSSTSFSMYSSLGSSSASQILPQTLNYGAFSGSGLTISEPNFAQVLATSLSNADAEQHYHSHTGLSNGVGMALPMVQRLQQSSPQSELFAAQQQRWQLLQQQQQPAQVNLRQFQVSSAAAIPFVPQNSSLNSSGHSSADRTLDRTNLNLGMFNSHLSNVFTPRRLSVGGGGTVMTCVNLVCWFILF